MMKYTLFFFLLFIIACSTCEVKDGQDQDKDQGNENSTDSSTTTVVQEEPFDFKTFFDGVDTVDACVAKNEGFSGLSLRLDKGIQAPIDKINSASVLKQLYYEASKKRKEAGPKKEIRCSDKNAVIQDRTMKRLGKLDTDESTVVLVELFKDTSLTFVGNEAKTLMKVMSRGGDKMLELLEPVKDQRPRIGQSIVTSLKNGKPLN